MTGGPALNRLSTSTFVINHPDASVLRQMLAESIEKAIESAETDMTENGFIMERPDLTLVSHNGTLFGTLLVWGHR